MEQLKLSYIFLARSWENSHQYIDESAMASYWNCSLGGRDGKISDYLHWPFSWDIDSFAAEYNSGLKDGCGYRTYTLKISQEHKVCTCGETNQGSSMEFL